MIPRLDGWSRAWHDDLLVLRPLDRPAAGAIAYSERRRPVVAVAALVAAELAAAGAEVVAIGAPEELVTREGEHGARVTARARLGGVEVQVDLGVVYADDSYARIGGMCREPGDFERFTETVRGLALADEQMLGVRRRTFRYTPPAGWRARVRGFEDIWFAPDGQACINVPPALPSGGYVAGHVEGLLAQGGLDAVRPHVAGGLTGAIGATRDRLAVLLEDARYLYSVRLEATSATALAAHGPAFHALVASVQPVPGRPRPGAALEHWS